VRTVGLAEQDATLFAAIKSLIFIQIFFLYFLVVFVILNSGVLRCEEPIGFRAREWPLLVRV
jgi:hypothetical protein